MNTIDRFINSRNYLNSSAIPFRKSEAEGGCGVIGLACEEKVAGRHLLPALKQMRNRGNGKGGGIAAVGLSAKAFNLDQEVLENDYLLAIAYLDRNCQHLLEKDYIHSIFEVDHVYKQPHLSDYRVLPGLDVEPPFVICYFVRVKKNVRETFIEKNELQGADIESIDDEIVYQNSYRLNRSFYQAEGEKKAFVLSQGKNMLVLKMVGYGDDVIRYYKLEEFEAHVWIGHHRYPTKGKVWHPGGAHPFVGLNEALVHNGDFANYFSICQYLAQRDIHPLFLTDTEVAALLFDLLYRNYRYPLEYVIEALAPTTERDFALLPKDKQSIYNLLQKTHIHGSPDGPWFFLIAQSTPIGKHKKANYRLLGITDTSMLRPQVFALQKGVISIGLSASEKQAIDATLKSLSDENSHFWPQADFYWSARGGSYTDGGAFIFTIHHNSGRHELECTDKFGNRVHSHALKEPYQAARKNIRAVKLPNLDAWDLYSWAKSHVFNENYEDVNKFIAAMIYEETTDEGRSKAFTVLTLLRDHRYPLGKMRRSSVLALIDMGIQSLATSIRNKPSPLFVYVAYGDQIGSPDSEHQSLVLDAKHFPSEGEGSLALAVVNGYKSGFKKFIVFNCIGQRFLGNGLGPNTKGIRIDVFGSSGDYLGSGIDGAEIYVHESGQDQLAQIMKDGKLVIYGDVGQTFLYGAKGGLAFVRGNAAGRPLINAVGQPRVVINGTCLDYLAESFMAGVPLKGGGFVILNGITFDEAGRIIELETPYPGNNLFSLASGGALYMRDPDQKIVKAQLNGGEFGEMTLEDWNLILPFLEENERLFGISQKRLLHYNGEDLKPAEVYRKIIPSKVHVLQEEEAWVKGRT